MATDQDMDEDTRETGTNYRDERKEKSNSYIAKALDLYPSLIYDPYVKKKIQRLFYKTLRYLCHKEGSANTDTQMLLLLSPDWHRNL